MIGGATLDLAQITLCAATSVNVAATVRALEHCMRSCHYGRVMLFTDSIDVALPVGVERVSIARLASTRDYSRFLLHELHRWISTPYCLVVQWDGFVLNPDCWDPQFLECDYIGAPWPQFEDGLDVGNGGFSLRSRRLLLACLDPEFRDDGQAEDLTIARGNRAFLERKHAIRFADSVMAARFSCERALERSGGRSAMPLKRLETTFGFHGVFNMVPALGPDEFAVIYRSLDHVGTLRTDIWLIARQLLSAHGGRRMAFQVMVEVLLAGSFKRLGRRSWRKRGRVPLLHAKDPRNRQNANR